MKQHEQPKLQQRKNEYISSRPCAATATPTPRRTGCFVDIFTTHDPKRGKKEKRERRNTQDDEQKTYQ